mgnify:CR=1 FL=1
MLLDRAVFRMYVKDGCPYCDKAREIITRDLSSTLQAIDVTNHPDLQRNVAKETGHKTVPAIFLGDEFVGGCDDLSEKAGSSDFRVRVLTEEVNILRSEIMRLRRSF